MLDDSITGEKERIDELTDTISAKTKRSAALADQIGELGSEIEEREATAAAAQKNREAGNTAYTVSNKDLAATIKAIDLCLAEFQKAKTETNTGLLAKRSKTQHALSLLERHLSTEDMFRLHNSVAQPSNEEIAARGDYKKHIETYTFKTDNVIELLKALKQKFEDAKSAGVKGETDSVNSYNLAKQAQDAAIKAAKDSKAKKVVLQAGVDKDKIKAEGDKKTEEADLEADEKTLAATEKSCRMKQSEWEERSQIRSGELQAIDAAVSILAKATGVRTKVPDNPILPASPTKFLQIEGDPRARAVEFLRQEAKVLKASALERLAQQIAAAGPITSKSGPFDDIINMIEKMIFRLQQEQTDEDEHKNWCDLELNKTDLSIADKTARSTSLAKKIAKEKATVTTLTGQIADANGMVAQITQFMAEAAKIRKLGKAENKEAIADAQKAQKAISDAIAVLTDFYKETGAIKKEAWEFVQRGVNLPDAPGTWDSSYTEVADPTKQPGGIITVLERVSAGFAKMEADSRANDAADQSNYDEEVQKNKIEQARRATEADEKEAEKQRTVAEIESLTKEEHHVRDELDATKQYDADLQHACVDGDKGVTYVDRKKARQDEIDALHKAQDILTTAFDEPDKLDKPKKGGSFLQMRL